MTPLRRAAAIALLLARSGPVAAQDTKPAWFTPPPAGKTATTTVDMTQHADVETITVIAKRASRSWRSQVTEHLNDPMASDAARRDTSFVAPQSHCNPTLRTVGGQPASAADMVTGSGAGGC